MTTHTVNPLTVNIAEVHGIGPKTALAFRRLGIRCVADLILHLPMRYEHELAEQSIAKASEIVSPHHGSEANIAVCGEIATVRSSRGRHSRTEATLEDDTGTLKITWFNAPWMRGKLHPGATVHAWGKVKRHGDYMEMVNPRWEYANADEPHSPRGEQFRPVYPASEDLSSHVIEQAVLEVLDPTLSQLEDHLHEEYRKQRAFPTLAESYRMVHRPQHKDESAHGRRRLAFDELLMMQLAVFIKRRHRRESLIAPSLKHNAAIDAHITARFPFTLTNSQQAVISEIACDLSQTVPMNRLLQGDVGSGKTVVALYAMLMAVAAKHQAAMMAPTELLAEQHFQSISQMLSGSKVTIEVLTGSLTEAERKNILKRLADGEIDILIGTHALLTESVRFKSLAVAVIDEQHRFGVHQRAILRVKSDDVSSTPHMLAMTATPIPRTMSLTLFGDLDISSIRGLPPGRKPVITKLVTQSKADEVYKYLAKRIEDGEQAYIVVPAVEQSQRELKDVQSHLEWLSQGHLKGKRLAQLHGRVDRKTREQIMQDFRAGDIDVLVATTVIEVGVDVPNASVMIVEHADNFGLAQLHQMRGRIGRGSKKSLCVLIADPKTDDAKARLEAIVSTDDGFAIAEMDLQIRGPGELFGAKQSGLAPFRVAQLPHDIELLRLARSDAKQWIEEFPSLKTHRDDLLKKRLLKAYGEALGIGDVG